MYYKENVNLLGESRAVVYANKYVNCLQLGCRYTDQNEVNKLCPEYIKNIQNIPDFFKNMIANIE
jgi:hypothetical protein